MKTYRVYKHDAFGYETVKTSGVSIPFLFFGLTIIPLPIALLFKKFWTQALIYVICLFIFFKFFGTFPRIFNLSLSEWGFGEFLGFYIYFIYIFALTLTPAYLVSNWEEGKLRKEGYKLIDEIKTASAKKAILLVQHNFTTGVYKDDHELLSLPKKDFEDSFDIALKIFAFVTAFLLFLKFL